MISPRRFTPASIQSFASCLILERMVSGEECLFLKTLAFLSFQISQVARRRRDAKALLFVMCVHQSLSDSVVQEGIPIMWLIQCQSRLVNLAHFFTTDWCWNNIGERITVSRQTPRAHLVKPIYSRVWKPHERRVTKHQKMPNVPI